MALIGLGLRLAVAGGRAGRRRAALAVAGAAIGVAVLLMAVAVARLVPADQGSCGGWLSCSQRTQGTVLIFLGAPVAVLLATVARLSASVRDRRLAALRLLGTSARATRVVAAVETGALAVAGVAVGLPLFLLVRQAVKGVAVGGLSHFGSRLTPGLAGTLAVICAVPLLAVAVSLAPTRRVTAAPLSLRRGAVDRRPRAWRLVPFAAGIALLGYVAGRSSRLNAGSPAPFLAGSALAAVGLPLAVPVAVRLGADGLARHARGVSVRLGARRLQLEPAASTRVVAALLTGLLLAVGAQGVVVAFERTPQYLEALRAETTGPQYLQAVTGQPVTRTDLLAVAGIRAAVPIRQANSPDAPVDAFLGTCADLRVLMPGLLRCDDSAPAWLNRGEQHPSGALALTVDQPSGPVPFAVAAPARTWPVDYSAGNLSGAPGFSLFIPLSTPGLPPAVTAVAWWWVTADGGAGPRTRLQTVLQRTDPQASVQATYDVTNLDLVRRFRAILWAATALVLLVGFLALAIAGVDRATERRRAVVGLHVLGVPARVVRRSHLVQALLPLAVGVPVAGAGGLLTARAYLVFGGEAPYTPWVSSLAVTTGALLVGALLALVTLPLVSRRVAAEHLRRE